MHGIPEKKRRLSPKSGHRRKQLDERRAKMGRSWKRRSQSSLSPSSTDSPSTNERRVKRVEKAQRFLERKDPSYRAWRKEERTREREKDLRRQGEAPAAAMVSRWDEALRRCETGASRGAEGSCDACGNEWWCFPDLSACPTIGGAPGGWRRGGANDEQRFDAKTHKIASGLTGSLLQGPGIHSGGLHTGRCV